MTVIEEMAGMDVLCSDKTRTLTLNKLARAFFVSHACWFVLTHLFLCLLWFVQAHTKFLSLSFHRKKCFLWFVLTCLFICLLWFVPAHTKFLSLSFHRKKLSLVICANSPFPLFIVVCACPSQVFALVLS